MRKSVKRALGAGVASGVAYAAWRAWNKRVPARAPGGVEWSSAPFPFPPVPRSPAPVVSAPAPKPVPPKPTKPKAAAQKAAAQKAATQKAAGSRTSSWVEPKADGTCPKSHPIKAKMKSGIFHAPGGANYERTKPDRCYVDAAAAEADGLRPAKA